MIRSLPILFLLASVVSAEDRPLNVRTIAGNGQKGGGTESGIATQTPCTDPFAVLVLNGGAQYWIAEAATGTTRVVDRQTNRSSLRFEKKLGEPYDFAADKDAGRTWVVARLDHAVYEIKNKAPEMIAGTGKPGPAVENVSGDIATFNEPHDLCLDGQGGLLVCDIKNHVLRRIDLESKDHRVTIFGEQRFKEKPLRGPRVIVKDTDQSNQGGFIIAYRESNQLFRLDSSGTVIRHLAGTGKKGYFGDGGQATDASLGGPKGLAIAPNGDIYFADTENHVVRRIVKDTGVIETVVGDGKKGDGPDGSALKCRLSRPHGISFDNSTLLIADSGNHRVRAVDVGEE